MDKYQGSLTPVGKMEIIFNNLSLKKANLHVLILESQNIRSKAQKKNQGFTIMVEEKDREIALQVIRTYYRENRYFRLKKQIENFPVSSFKSYTAFFIMFILWAVHLYLLHSGLKEQWIFQFGSSALYILQGEIFRTITALFLHADGQHLLGNIGGLLIFGAPLITLTGYGTGPFLLLFSGALGNYFNALFFKTAHLSIGASTAIMGAAGLLAAFQMTRDDRPFKINRLFSLMAGAALVGMFSQGKNTDISAHVFGFVSGVGAGLFFFFPAIKYKHPIKEPLALIIVILIVITAFLNGF